MDLHNFITNNSSIKNFIVVEDKKIKIAIKDNFSFEKKVIFQSGTHLFRIYNKISNKIKEYGFSPTPLENLKGFKEFSRLNIGEGKFFVVFSSEGVQGAWDLSTMSMRGIENCQSWNGLARECLIGSIISKYVGIIYLTSGSKHSELGENMMSRCIVRFGLMTREDKPSPVVIVDKMHPLFNRVIANIFISALKSRTRVPVVDLTAGILPFLEEFELLDKREKYDFAKKHELSRDPYHISYSDTIQDYVEPKKQPKEGDEILNYNATSFVLKDMQVKLHNKLFENLKFINNNEEISYFATLFDMLVLKTISNLEANFFGKPYKVLIRRFFSDLISLDFKNAIRFKVQQSNMLDQNQQNKIIEVMNKSVLDSYRELISEKLI
jgi:hypothetical protein